jgi:hypothetical protein
MAGTTGLEPAASAVTGQRSNQLNYVPNMLMQRYASRHLAFGVRPWQRSESSLGSVSRTKQLNPLFHRNSFPKNAKEGRNASRKALER